MPDFLSYFRLSYFHVHYRSAGFFTWLTHLCLADDKAGFVFPGNSLLLSIVVGCGDRAGKAAGVEKCSQQHNCSGQRFIH
jgi:hypothetical protein